MTANLQSLINGLTEAHERLEAAKESVKVLEASIAELCPAKPGTVFTQTGFHAGEPMYVERVGVTNWGNGRFAWVVMGKKVTKAGKPHATATAQCYVEMPADPAQVQALLDRATECLKYERIELGRLPPTVYEHVGGQRNLVLRPIRDAARELGGIDGASALYVVCAAAQNASQTMNEGVASSEWTRLFHGSIAGLLSNDDNLRRRTGTFFIGHGITY